MLLKLFLGFLQVGLFTFGGGYASLPLVQQQVVEGGWMEMDEFVDMLAISQMTPGPIAINLATFVGLSTAGVPGAVIATIAYVLPSFIIVSILAWMYRKYGEIQHFRNAMAGLRPASVGLILSAGLSIVILSIYGDTAAAFVLTNLDIVAIILVVGAFVCLRAFKTPQIAVIAACGAIGGVCYTLL